MACMNALALRLRVEKKTQPPGLTNAEQTCTTDAGSGTCYSNSMQVNASKLAGCSWASASALSSRYWIFFVPASSACSCATHKDLDAKSMPSTSAPLPAIASVNIPPPMGKFREFGQLGRVCIDGFTHAGDCP